MEIQKQSNSCSQFNILIAINHLKNLGGSEMYTYTLASHLASLGHTVDVVTYSEGEVSNNLDEQSSNLNLISSKVLFTKEYDLAVISHNSIFVLPIKADFIIQVCHGIYPDLEQPSYLADYHIAISEEVSNHLTNLGFRNEIVSNPINFERFQNIKPINKKVKNILSLCQGGSANKLLKAVCDEEGYNLVCYSKNGESVWDIENAINDADLVVSIGRGVIESMACGRSILVFDHRNYAGNCSDGLLIEENIKEIKKNNFSGRTFRFKATKEFLKTEILKYDVSQGEFNARFAKNNFDVEKISQQIFRIVKTKKKNTLNKEVLGKLFALYDNNIIFNEIGKPYFIKHNQKCLLTNINDLEKYIEKFKLDEIRILNQKEDILNYIPEISFNRMHRSFQHFRIVEHNRRVHLKRSVELNTIKT